MTLPSERLGYKGQKYKVTAEDGDGKRFTVGWSDDPTGGSLVEAAKKHPSWCIVQIIPVGKAAVSCETVNV